MTEIKLNVLTEITTNSQYKDKYLNCSFVDKSKRNIPTKMNFSLNVEAHKNQPLLNVYCCQSCHIAGCYMRKR